MVDGASISMNESQTSYKLNDQYCHHLFRVLNRVGNMKPSYALNGQSVWCATTEKHRVARFNSFSGQKNFLRGEGASTNHVLDIDEAWKMTNKDNSTWMIKQQITRGVLVLVDFEHSILFLIWLGFKPQKCKFHTWPLFHFNILNCSSRRQVGALDRLTDCVTIDRLNDRQTNGQTDTDALVDTTTVNPLERKTDRSTKRRRLLAWGGDREVGRGQSPITYFYLLIVQFLIFHLSKFKTKSKVSSRPHSPNGLQNKFNFFSFQLIWNLR